jgi:hypothetical protein
MATWRLIPCLALGVFAVAGCSGSADDQPAPDMATADLAMPDLTISDLSFPPPDPVAMTNHGGPVLAAPETWIIVWPGDETLGEKLDAFYRDLYQSFVWGKTMGQYGVSGGQAMGIVVVGTPKPPDIAHDDIPALVGQMVKQVNKTANTVMVVLIPSTTMETGVPAGELGYHNETGGIPFAVLRQTTTPTVGATTFEDLTFFASHEVAEVATDPYLNTKPAWFDDVLGAKYGEIADLCNPTSQYINAVSDGGMPSNHEYLAARFYSNSGAAMKGGDPCWAPAQGDPYFFVGGTPRTVPSGSGFVELEVVAFGDVGMVDWTIQGMPPGVTVKPASGTNVAGDRIPVTITVPQSVTDDFPLLIAGTSETTLWTNLYWLMVQH